MYTCGGKLCYCSYVQASLSYHSEKFVVAFGIISTPSGTTILLFNKFRTRVDCHSDIKFIS